MSEAVHPVRYLGPHAVKLFEQIVEHTTVRRKPGKTGEKLYNDGFIFIRNEDCWTGEAEMSATLDAWEDYSAYLDAIGE